MCSHHTRTFKCSFKTKRSYICHGYSAALSGSSQIWKLKLWFDFAKFRWPNVKWKKWKPWFVFFFPLKTEFLRVSAPCYFFWWFSTKINRSDEELCLFFKQWKFYNKKSNLIFRFLFFFSNILRLPVTTSKIPWKSISIFKFKANKKTKARKDNKLGAKDSKNGFLVGQWVTSVIFYFIFFSGTRTRKVVPKV